MSVHNNDNGHENGIDPEFFERLNESLSSDDDAPTPFDLTGLGDPDSASTGRKVTKNGNAILKPNQTA